MASLTLPNGNVVEFYDLKTGAIVSELGKAYSSPGLNLPTEGGADELTGIWRQLAPDVPVPSALAQLQQRLTNLPPDTPTQAPTGEPVSSQSSELALGPGNGVLAAPDGCDNGCCDFEWLTADFWQCRSSGSADYKWRFYNYGWSWVNKNNVYRYDGFVCAATGTSQWRVAVEGGGGINWSIPQQYYRTYWWRAGQSCNPFCHYNRKDIDTNVNTSSSMALHTYCGHIIL